MPLNPEEVVNKRFSATKFRQGYDEEEVDEFLDEVVAELRRLNAENTELRSKLTACEGRVAELTRTAAQAQQQAQQAQAQAKATTAATAAVPAPAPAPAPAPTPAPAPAPAPASGGAESAAGMLALAQKLHDEHVDAGKAERAKIVADAQAQASRLVRDAEQKQRETLGDLEQQRQVLQTKVDQLKSFEREYRSRLKAYLESQLEELESKAPASSAQPEAETAKLADSGTSGLPSRGPGLSSGEATGSGESTQSTPRFPFGS